jgi:glycosyltransferase involved in cell wall biosynthesis
MAIFFRIAKIDFNLEGMMSLTPENTHNGSRSPFVFPVANDQDVTRIPDSDKNARKLVVAVIPAYNEQIALGSVILLTRQYVDRVIVVDDGSTDKTFEVATLAGAEVIRLEKNSGKAQALLMGLRHARELDCAATIILDADGQHRTVDIPHIAAPVLAREADLVIGSRFILNNGDIPLYRMAGQKTLNLFTNFGTQYTVSDTQSGFRALSRNALDHLDFQSRGYNIESDMIDHFVARGLVIREVPINVRYEVPHKHKMNPVKHGFSVFSSLINLISYRRPLLAFGIPGAVFIIGGMIAEFWVFAELYSGKGFHWMLGIGSAFVLVLGMLLVIAGLILNGLVSIMERKRDS